jgi:hypothetical protein
MPQFSKQERQNRVITLNYFDRLRKAIAPPMVLRDWKHNMQKAHFIIRAFHKIEPDYENHKSYMISEWIDKQSSQSSSAKII